MASVTVGGLSKVTGPSVQVDTGRGSRIRNVIATNNIFPKIHQRKVSNHLGGGILKDKLGIVLSFLLV